MLSFSGKSYDEITTRDIRKWLLFLEDNGYKSGTIKYKIFGLRKFYQYCLEEESVKYIPVEGIILPKDEDKLPHYLTNKQLIQLRSLCEGNLRQRAMIEVLYTTGIRLGELINMKKEDINWSERMIVIPKGKGKKERIVLFTKECAEYLTSYLQSRNDDLNFVFVNKYGTRPMIAWNIQEMFGQYRKAIGVYFTPHTLRHTFAAQLAMKGMPLSCIQTLLGHEEPKHTHYYSRLHQQAQKQMYDEWM
ncbi:tyrosine-type recombinase/integrase [Fictibacillus sp. 18YEL24]|nr:tyrosine-type recombinase/integrase [Fictibacillus sp. 18YEL24]